MRREKENRSVSWFTVSEEQEQRTWNLVDNGAKLIMAALVLVDCSAPTFTKYGINILLEGPVTFV